MSVPMKRERFVGFIHRNTRCWTRLNECWNRRLSKWSRVATALLAPLEKRSEVRDAEKRALMRGLYGDGQCNGKEMSQKTDISGPKC